MGGIRILGPTRLLTDGVMTGTNVLHSGPMDMMSMPYAAFEAIWTGDPVGTFTIDGSIDGVNWYDTGSEVTNPSGTPASTLENLGFPAGFRYIRLSYTNASGNGLLTINGMAKAGGG